MAGTENGALSFKALMDTGQITEAIKQTIGQIRDLSDVAVAEGQKTNDSFQRSSDSIKVVLTKLGEAWDEHMQKIATLEAQYEKLQDKAGNVFMAGRDEEYSKILHSMGAIEGEIVARKSLLKEIEEYSNTLEKQKNKIEENANVHRTLRQQIFDVKEAMHQLTKNGISSQSEAYRMLSEELGRLRNIQRDIERQGTILSNDQSNFQGIISGLSGVAGGLAVATGAMALFGDENEDLQRVMAKVQTVMSITIGMQQVSQALNENSAFQLVTLNKLKAWWAKIVAEATRAEATETGVTQLNTIAKKQNALETGKATVSETLDTAAKGANTAAATAGTFANLTLAGAFRALGLAIKSFPVFGWIASGITALAAIVSHFSNKAKEAKKRVEELNKSMTEIASKPIASLIKLQAEWISLGNNMQAKQKLIEKSRKTFEDLNMAINDTYDAEKRLMDPAHIKAFIQAQLMKAKGSALLESEDYKKKLQEAANLEAQIMEAEDKFRKAKEYKNEDLRLKTLYDQYIKIQKLKKKLAPINDFLLETSKKSVQITIKGQKTLDNLNKEALEKQKQTVAGKKALLEKELEDLEYQRGKLLATDKKKIAEYDKKIKAKQKEIDELEPHKEKEKYKKEKDPFIEQLEKKKQAYSEYVKWINSDDEKVRSAANKQFSGLLKEGNSYIDYLKKQREQLLSVGNRSQEQNKNLASINKAIAEESKKTLLDVFKDALKEQIDGIDTITGKIDKIKELKENLSEDDPLKAQKTEVLDEAMGTMVNKAKEETQALYKEYADYYDKKVALHKKYLNDIALLEEAKKNAKTDKEKDKIDRTIKVRKERHDEDIKKIDGYDEMIAAYGTFEQKKQAIIEDFEEKRKKARERGDQEMIKSLDKAQGEAVSKLSLDELIKNPDWSKMFENLDEIATEELDRLQAMIEEKKISLGAELSPKDFEVIMERLKAMKAEIKERNPFKGLIQSVKDYSSATDSVSKKSSLTNMFSSASESIGLVKEAFDAVVDGIKNMGIQMDAETEKILSDIGSILDGAGQLAAGIASGNPLDIIKGSIGLFTSAMDLLNTKDRDAQRSIRRNQKAVRNLERAYDDLSRSIDRALGSDKYNKQKEAINNLRQQEAHLREMERSEREKKKSNEDKVQEYQDKQKELQRKQQDIINGMRDDIIGMDAKTAAEQLGDAFISAFARGEDAVKAFGKKTDEIVANIMKKMLIQKLLEQPIGKIIDQYSKKWIDEKGNFIGFDSVNEDAEAMGEELKGLAEGFQKAGGKFMEKLGSMMSVGDTTLTGAVKGVTEETAGIVAGQLNAIRIRQSESADLLRQQLMHLSEIASNTRYNKHLESIDRKLSSTGNDSLRSKGASHV